MLVGISFCLIPLGHLFINWALWIEFSAILDGEVVTIGDVQAASGNSLVLLAMHGDVLDPKANNREIEFDLVPVSCFIDPIRVDTSSITWVYNDFLKNALKRTASDPITFQALVEEAISTMSENGEFISRFLPSHPQSYALDDPALRREVTPYFWNVPKQGIFYRDTRITRMVAVPIFYPRHVGRNVPSRKILKANLNAVVKRIFSAIGTQKLSDVNSVAFAALAGTSRRPDSHRFLTYKESFFGIHEALQESYVPTSVDRIYLVTYDKLRDPDEARDSINALFAVFRHSRHFQIPRIKSVIAAATLRALPYTTVFCFLYWATSRKRNVQADPDGRVDRVLRLWSIMSMAAVLYTGTFELALQLLLSSFALLILAEVVISAISFWALVKLNDVRPKTT